MDFPEKEARTILDWMRQQMYGSTVTGWTYGDEHDCMMQAADLLETMISANGRQPSCDNCKFYDECELHEVDDDLGSYCEHYESIEDG